MKKVMKFIGLALLLGINFLGTEYLLYALLSAENKLYYLFFALFMLLIAMMIALLDRLKIFKTAINACLVLLSVFLGLGMLKVLLTWI